MMRKKEAPEVEEIESICHAVMNEKQRPNPPQHQNTQPGLETEMVPPPQAINFAYQGANKLKDKVVLITGGDSGIGHAVGYLCAVEGAKVAFVYLNEDEDAMRAQEDITSVGAEVLAIKQDLRLKENCEKTVKQCIDHFKKIDVLINNAAVQYTTDQLEEISEQQLENTFLTNIFSYFYMSQCALPYLKKQCGCIVNSTSVTAYRGSGHLVDYSATKGAIVSFTRSLAKQLEKDHIRVNAVAPGPVWTPLIPASFSSEHVSEFGNKTLYSQPAQPADIAPCYIFLACNDSRFMTGQVLHPNGGEIING